MDVAALCCCASSLPRHACLHVLHCCMLARTYCLGITLPCPQSSQHVVVISSPVTLHVRHVGALPLPTCVQPHTTLMLPQLLWMLTLDASCRQVHGSCSKSHLPSPHAFLSCTCFCTSSHPQYCYVFDLKADGSCPATVTRNAVKPLDPLVIDNPCCIDTTKPYGATTPSITKMELWVSYQMCCRNSLFCDPSDGSLPPNCAARDVLPKFGQCSSHCT